MNQLRLQIEKAVIQAGEIFNSIELDKEIIVKKGCANYATHVDYQVQEFFLKELDNILPGCNIITEESNSNTFTLDKPTFILDPVDGTTNLMHNYMHSAISLGLVVDGKPYIGIVYNPSSKEMFVGEAGKGAKLNGKNIRVSQSADLRDSLIGFGTTPYDRNNAKITFERAQKIFMNCQDLRRSGSAALDIAYVACGRIDGFFELNLQAWDFAGGLLILSEAGGKITNWTGEPLNILSSGSVLATNGLIHKQIAELLV